MPPTLNMLLTWSTMFRSSGTFGNYLGYVKTACMLEEAPTEVDFVLPHIVTFAFTRACGIQVFDDPALQKAKKGVDKRSGFKKREPRWVRRWMIERFLDQCCLQQKSSVGGDVMRMGMLFLMSYIFLLRVPSEALPAQAHQGGHSVLSIENGRLILVLQRRFGAPRAFGFCFHAFCHVPGKTSLLGVD